MRSLLITLSAISRAVFFLNTFGGIADALGANTYVRHSLSPEETKRAQQERTHVQKKQCVRVVKR